MAVQIGGRHAPQADRKLQIAQSKARNQKIILGVGGVILLLVLAVELPSTLSKLSANSSAPATAAVVPLASNPVQAVSATAAVPVSSPSLARFRRFPLKDPFVPQLGAPVTPPGSPKSPAGNTIEPQGPAVSTKLFAKDPFVPQVAAPAATAPATSNPSSVAVTPSALPKVLPGRGYVVVVASAPPGGGAAAARRALVAAENAGLPDVHSSVLRTQAGVALDVYTGPFATEGLAQQELIRALRVGYTLASVQMLPHTQPSL